MNPNPDRAKSPDPSPSSQPQDQRREPTNLSYRYGTIGIEAVAAAVRYSGSRKNPADEPAVQRIDQRFVEAAI